VEVKEEYSKLKSKRIIIIQKPKNSSSSSSSSSSPPQSQQMDRILSYLFRQAPAQNYSIPMMSMNKNSAYFIVKHNQLTEKHLCDLILCTRMIISEICFITQFQRMLLHLPPLNLLQSMTSSHFSLYAHLIHNLPDSRNSLKSGSTPRMGCAAVRFKYRSNDALRFSTNSADEPCSAWFDIFIFVIPVNIDQTSYKVQIHDFFLSYLISFFLSFGF